MSRATSSRGGYTLLELMIVLAILTSLVALAWPHVHRRLQRSLPREAALQLKADLAEAREEAVRRGEPWVCRYQPGTGHYQIAPADSYTRPPASAAAIHQSDTSFVGASGPSTAEITGPGRTSEGDVSLDTTSTVVDQDVIQVNHTPQSSGSIRELPLGVAFQQTAPVPMLLAGPGSMGGQDSRSGTAARSQTVLDSSIVEETRQDSSIDGAPHDESESAWVSAVVFQPDGRATDTEISLLARETSSTIRVRIRGLTGGTKIGKVKRLPAPVGQPQEPNNHLQKSGPAPELERLP